MYSPKELEGEVDHTFFDSDCEANGGEGRQNERKGNNTHVSMDQLETEDQSGRNRNDSENSDYMRDRKSSNASFKGSSPVPSAKDSEARTSSQSDEGSSVESYSSDEQKELDDVEENNDFRNRKTSNANGDDDDGYHRSEDESDEEERSLKTRPSKHKGPSHGTPKKSAGKFRNLSRNHLSSSSSSSSSSSDLESSSSSEGRSPVHSPSQHHRVDSASQRRRLKSSETAESEDTVTDVTPLSTPNVSPAQSIDVVLPSEPLIADAQHRHSDAEETAENEEVSDDQGSLSSEAFLKVEKQLDRMLVVSSPVSVGGRSSRKNYSFTNEEVRQIDRENQRLLRELSRSAAHSRSGSSACSNTSSQRSNAPPIRLYHSALNRQREQERIQKENLSFLKRLESVKATPGITRDEQLADYQRQCRYLGTHVTSVPPPKPKLNKTSGRSSVPSSSPHRTRAETAKPSNRATPRPAWS